MRTRPVLRTVLAATAAASLSFGIAACGSDSTAGQDAVAIGGTFEFVSPGGQTEITYDQADRKQVGDL